MKFAFTVQAFLYLICVMPVLAQPAADPTAEILALERQVMDGWLKGDPGPALAISDPQITFIHEMTEQRLEGLAALKTLYDPRRGTPLFDRYEILNPKVHSAGGVAILTYQLAQHVGGSVRYWNGTEVFRTTSEGWRVIHSHWSRAKAQ